MYYVIEIQKMNSGAVSMVPPVSKEERPEAEQAYHTALAAAAVSSVDCHTVLLINDIGACVYPAQTYYHGQVPDPEA